ncbi:Interleukin-13 [Galemys pyrenaicus]|uniref:Interleukin-13 n=1 Tax=Galemys pyrenaicus TaxID=202257 RepID=A0A8J5ZNF4_GALPY|nr:Interleukin-13 [Galemys pyrenaicus]
MALWLTVLIALTCLGGITSPSPVSTSKPLKENQLKELITELNNITLNPKALLCNGSMVWSVNLTADVHFCAASESLKNVSNCSAIQKIQRMLYTICHNNTPKDKHSSSALVQDTKIEVIPFLNGLRKHLKQLFRHK